MKMIRKQLVKYVYKYNLRLISDRNITLKLSGSKINRKIFLITKEDIGKITLSLGTINKCDIDKYYVIDTYPIDNNEVDYITK